MPQGVMPAFTKPNRYIPKNHRGEDSVQRRVCTYLRRNYPRVYFRTDTVAGLFLSENQYKAHHAQQSGPRQPDMTIYKPSRGFHGLLLEIKDEGVQLKRKRNGRKIAEGDYKIRRAGDWYNPHIEQQARVLDDLADLGYCTAFVRGFKETISFIDWYMERPEQVELGLQ